MWEWENEAAIRKCNPESFSAYDFEVFGYEIDVKTSRDVSAFRPSKLLDQDPDDEIIVMVWHRDNEDGLILLGWERVETLKPKVSTQEAYSGDEPTKLDHLAARPMNELMDLGPNTANMNQKPQNPFSPGDRVPPNEEVRTDVPEDEAVEAIRSFYHRFEYASRRHAQFELVAEVGIRLGALRAVDLEDLEIEKAVIHLQHRPDSDYRKSLPVVRRDGSANHR